MQFQQFQVNKSDLSQSRIMEGELQQPGEGQCLLKIQRFALTANNVTYGVVGERIGYWKFFPAMNNEEEQWGIIPVWGFAEVVESRSEGINAGEVLYGYFPMASHIVIEPTRVRDDSLTDGIAHRSELPPVYNSYRRMTNDPTHDPSMADDRMVLHPLYATSFCLKDFFEYNDWFGANQLIITSASSKTSIGTAYALQAAGSAPISIGLTSQGNLQQVHGLDLYSKILTYDQLDHLDASAASAIIDMSGNGKLLSDLHAHLGDNMKYCSMVGLTHWDENSIGPDFNRDRSAMFFAPGHIQKRTQEMGPGEFQKQANEFWHDAALKSRSWLQMTESQGLDEAKSVFETLRTGGIAANQGLVVVV